MGTTGLYRPPLPQENRLAKAGEKMRPIRTSKPGVTWLQGPGPTDLFTLHDAAGGIQEQELTFFGRTVVLRGEELSTGLCHEGGPGAYMGKTGVLVFDRHPSGETLQAALALLGHVPTSHPEVQAVADRIARALEVLGQHSTSWGVGGPHPQH